MSALDQFRLGGRVALVTGASRGIGRALALGLADAGADVVVHYVGRADAAEEVVEQAQVRGVRSAAVQADLSDADAPQRIADEAQAKLGRVDILVLNASIQHPAGWDELRREDFDQQVVVNLRSAYEMIQLLGPAMVQRGWGRIVAIGSVQQYRPSPRMVPYAALKSALENMTRNLAKQLGPYGVTVNNLSPGIIATDRNAQALSDPEVVEMWRQRTAVQRIGTVEECVGATLLLCSDAGAYITGVDLPVDGGLRLP